MLAEQGQDALTMDGLAERAGLGKGTVFRRFGTRAGIFAALLDDDEQAFQQQVLAGPPPLGPGAPPLERLIAYGRARTGFLIAHGDIARAALDGQPAHTGRSAVTAVPGAHPDAARTARPGRRRPGHAGRPAHRRPGRSFPALPLRVRRHRGPPGPPNGSRTAGRTWSSASAGRDLTRRAPPDIRAIELKCDKTGGPEHPRSANRGLRWNTTMSLTPALDAGGWPPALPSAPTSPR